MGCSQSKIENEEAVARCKDRKHFMKLSVSSRNAFAAAHSSYSVALKNTGAALSDFSSGEVSAVTTTTAPTTATPILSSHPPPPPPIQTLPPPPPPIPDMPTPHSLQRAVSMPEFAFSKASKPGAAVGPTIQEDEQEEDEEDDLRRDNRNRNSNNKGGSVGSRIETTTPPPPVVEERRGGPPPPPPPPPEANGSLDYFIFNVEEMPRGSLEDEEEMRREREREENERKAFEERSRREKQMPPPPPPEVAENEKSPLPPVKEGGGGGKSLKKGKQVVGSNVNVNANVSGSGGGEVKKRSVSLVQVFIELDNYFLAASESAREVSKLLEAARLHYHSNFADNNGHMNHSERLMRVITWNRSFLDDGKDVVESEENETHATILDKLLAWERKLYDEVKAGEIMKFEYQKKVASLNRQKKHGANSEALEKIKATVSHLHTRYIVDMQSMDSTVSEINRLRDEQLYPKLVSLVEEMATMWDVMQEYHGKQLTITAALRSVDISQSAKETTDHHHDRTIQLWVMVQEWHGQFDKMVNHQKDYIRSLNGWLKLNLIPIESSLKEKVSSPPRAQNPPIQNLLLAWHDLLEKLPEEHAKSAIHSFGAVLGTIVEQQEDELKLRTKVEESAKDLDRKQRQYNKWIREYMQKKAPSDEMDVPSVDDGILKDEIMIEKELIVENAKNKLEDDRELYQRQCVHVREKTLTSLKARLPELFRALSDFAHSSSEMYRELKAISDSHSHKRS